MIHDPRQPSRTALAAAEYRAAHRIVEGGRIFADPLAVRIPGEEPDAKALSAAVERGARQLVILGAGLGGSSGHAGPEAPSARGSGNHAEKEHPRK